MEHNYEGETAAVIVSQFCCGGASGRCSREVAMIKLDNHQEDSSLIDNANHEVTVAEEPHSTSSSVGNGIVIKREADDPPGQEDGNSCTSATTSSSSSKQASAFTFKSSPNKGSGPGGVLQQLDGLNKVMAKRSLASLHAEEVPVDLSLPALFWTQGERGELQAYKRRKIYELELGTASSSAASSSSAPAHSDKPECINIERRMPSHNSVLMSGGIVGNASATATATSDRAQNEVLITQPSSVPESPLPSFASSSSNSLNKNVSYSIVTPYSASRSTDCVSTASASSSSSSSSSGFGSRATLSGSSKDQDWQESKCGIRERNAAMCNNELMADIHFRVSSNGGPSTTYAAHKYVLSIGSTVFYAMFYGGLAEHGNAVVIPDVEPTAFLKMLNYLYADNIELDEESVLPTFHVAKKYMIPMLAKACVQYMEANLTARNACVLLYQSRIYDEIELGQRCWEVIDAQAEIALNSEGFIEIDHSTLLEILSRETLNCKEIVVFEAAIAWATAECSRKELDLNADNLRNVLGNGLYLIRVPTMDLKEFADGPSQAGIFSLKECYDMFLHFTATVKPNLSYPVKKREGLKPQICHRFQSSAYRSNQWRYRGRCDSIQFMVDKRIFVIGFGLYGSSTGATTYGAQIELKRQGQLLAQNTTELFSDGSSNILMVYFDQPVQIDPEVFYTASVLLDGLELSYFGQEGMTDVTVGSVSFQFQCSSESTNGTGVQGGQIPELIFYGPNVAKDNNSGSSSTEGERPKNNQ